MLNKILNYSVIGILLLGLVGGTIYILARPSEAQAERGGQRDTELSARSQGYGQNRSTETESRNNVFENGARSGGQGNASSQGYAGGQGNGGAQGTGSGQGLGTGQGYAAEAVTPDAWETIQGTVLVADSDLTLATTDGDILVGLGPSWYREEAGFVLTVGDEVRIAGYNEDGEFKAGSVENLSSGEAITLRDETGHPMWSGWRGRSN